MGEAGAARRQAIFGAADGVTSVLGLLATLTGNPSALVKAAVGVGLAELVGMTAGSWLSDGDNTGFWPALLNGGSALVAILIPALPYAVTSGWAAALMSVALIITIAGVISWLRPERGWTAVAETYGVLVLAAVICIAASFI